MRTVLISGASGGIGAECARVFAQNGYSVVINYFSSAEAAQKLASELPSAIAVRADVSDMAQVNNMFALAHEKFGAINVLVNNAGIAHRAMLADTSSEEWNRIIGINLTGAYNCIKCALDDMMWGGGSIVNVSSIWGQCGGSCEAAYSAAKAGLIGLTKALAKELPGVRVNCVAPGVIDTKMNNDLSCAETHDFVKDIPIPRLGTAQEVAQAVYFLSSQEYITGQVLGVNGGALI